MSEINYETILHKDALEAKILCCIDTDNSSLIDIKKYLRPEMFTDSVKREIYELMLEINGDGRTIDLLSVTQLAREKGSKLESTDMLVTQGYGSPLDASTYAKVLAQGWILRRAKIEAQKVVELSDRPETDAFDLLENWQKAAEVIVDGTDTTQKTVDFKTAIEDSIAYMEEASSGLASGVPSDLTELDEETNGWQKGDLIIIAGRPGMGKSALVTTFVNNAANSGYACALFSLEMNTFQVTSRLVADQLQIPLGDITKRTLNEQQREVYKKDLRGFYDLPITIDDSSELTTDQLKSKARDLHRKGLLDLLVVDYLQLMSDKTAGNREQEIGSITRCLKSIAKELNIPVIALSQISRAVETRDNPRPKLSDLRESGSIEQDADMVMFLYRPEYYYDQSGDECPPDLAGICQLIIGKYRNGEGKDIKLAFKGQYSVFKDREDLHTNRF